MTEIFKYFIWFVFYSFLGWLYETLLCSFSELRLVDKRFLYGPFCPVYGLGAIAVIILLTPFKDNIFLLFFLGAAVTCAVEYTVAFFLEKIFRHKEWDYSWRRFNLHGRICLIGAFVFGIFSVLLIRWLHPAVKAMTERIFSPYLFIIGGILIIYQSIDFYLTFKNLFIFSRTSHIYLEK